MRDVLSFTAFGLALIGFVLFFLRARAPRGDGGADDRQKRRMYLILAASFVALAIAAWL